MKTKSFLPLYSSS